MFTEVSDLQTKTLETVRFVEGEIAIVRQFLTLQEAEWLRFFAQDLFLTSDDFIFRPIVQFETEDHVRRDDRPVGSRVKGISQDLMAFEWNRNRWPVMLARVYEKLLKARKISQLGNTKLGFPILNVRQYPRGGGELDMHTDPVAEQGLVALVGLSKKGNDFKEGGLMLERQDREIVDVDALINVGDLYVFSGCRRHGIEPIDPNRDGIIDWRSNLGRWMAYVSWSTPK